MQERLTLSESERRDFEAFKQSVYRKTGIDLNLYKAQQMHRRLRGMVERANLKSFVEYFERMERDPTELAAFLDRMTINVSELFRNPEKWEALRERVLGPMMERGRALRVWSAGCSFGAEPYSLAMLLDDLSPNARHFLLATDIDQKILEKARRGVFTEQDIKNVRPAFRQKYLRRRASGPLEKGQGSDFDVAPTLRERITFRRHNLLSDPFEGDMDLIVCRNVVIYFTEEAKDRLFARFSAALRPGGILFVGGTERIFNYRELGLDARIPFFYERMH